MGVNFVEQAMGAEVAQHATLHDVLQFMPVVGLKQGGLVKAGLPVGCLGEHAIEYDEVEVKMSVHSGRCHGRAGAHPYRQPDVASTSHRHPGPRVGPNPVAVLRIDNGGAGVETGAGAGIDEWTAAPAAPAGWDTRLDLDWAILALRE